MGEMSLRVFETTPSRSAGRLAVRALDLATRSWFVVTILGQLLFAFSVAAFYGSSAVRGNPQSWNRFMLRGWVEGDGPGNAAVALHLVSAVLIILAGALQFVPAIRARFPRYHRWSGRIYIGTALTLTLAGLYMHWVRGATGDQAQRIAGTLNAVVIWLCAAMALRYAMARDFRTHRRWAMRLFLAVSASWFYRASLFLIIAIAGGPVGFDPATFTGPLLTFMSFAVYAVPLGLLELYFRAQAGPGALRRAGMASVLFVLTLATAAGIVAVSATIWVPAIRAAFDSRKPVAATLAATIDSAGIERAVAQYHQLKAAGAPGWNFDEPQLNTLGYQLLRAGRHAEAIRVFQLNIEAYPRSSNARDSLGEAWLANGDREKAVASYLEALELDPGNGNSLAVLRRLGVRR